MLSSSDENYTELKLSNRRLFYLSTARSKTSSFFRSAIVDVPKYARKPWKFSVVIHLNGRLLGANYRARPADYFGVHQTYKTQRDYTGRVHEMEDRIYSDANKIPNAKRYIDFVEIHFPEINDPLTDKKPLRAVIDLLKQNNIPVVLYEAARDLISNNRKMSVDPQTLSLPRFNFEEPDVETFVTEEDKKTALFIIALINIKNQKEDVLPKGLSQQDFLSVYKKWKENIYDIGVIYIDELFLKNPDIANELRIISMHMRKENFVSVTKFVTKLFTSTVGGG
jgi:hypothetical protein